MKENQKGRNRFGRVYSLVLAMVAMAVTGYCQNGDPFNPSANGTVSALAVQPDGRILLGGDFTAFGSQSCIRLGRVNWDGTLDKTFNSGANSNVLCLAFQGDGKILVGGLFTTLSGRGCTNFGRLNTDGSLDTSFSPAVGGSGSRVTAVAIQPDGKVLVAGSFGSLCGQWRTNLGRLNSDGSLDAAFAPGVVGSNAQVLCLACQPDGKIVVGGLFTSLAGQARTNLGRLNANGTLESSFNPGPNGAVQAVALQPDGQLLVGGSFSVVCGQPRGRLGRLTPGGALDTSFTGGASNVVNSLVLQADGKVLVGGLFTVLAGQSRNYLGRLNYDGTADSGFDPGASGPVSCLGLQADGAILAGGQFVTLGGQPRNCVGRLTNSVAATQELIYDGWSLTWRRGGASPEVWRTTFEASVNRGAWFSLGDGQRISGGWWPIGWELPTDLSQVNIRARGFVAGALGNNSSWFVETIIGPVFFTRQPESRTNTLGTVANFSVAAGGSVPLEYRWCKGVAPLSDGGKISGAQTASLTLSNVVGAEAGSYSVILSNLYGAVTSQVAILTVEGDPQITAQPAGGTNNAGTIATFSVGAVGSSPTYQWRKDGVSLVDGGNISGAQTPVLTLNSVLGGDAGVYSVVVSSTYGSVTSQGARLTVMGDPSITVQPVSRTNTAGNAASFSVTVLGTAPSYQWRKDGLKLVDGPALGGARTGTLILSNALGGDAGEYSVVVSNTFGMVTSATASLKVVGDPFIVTQPRSQTNLPGETVQLMVETAGSEPLGYQWRKQGRDLADGGNLSGARSARLTLSNLSSLDVGGYSVFITNRYGQILSQVASLGVLTDPQILSPPRDCTNVAGTGASFSVAASGTQPLGYQWFKDGVALANTGTVSGAQSNTLVLRSVYGADAGDYWVEITNSVGDATSAAASFAVLDPYLTKQPASRVVQLGQGAIFTVGVLGSAPLCYQWRQDGMALAGATQSGLSVTNVQATNTGSYDVVVSNAWGSVTSAVANLSIQAVAADSFHIGADHTVNSFLPQADGHLLVGGAFTNLGGYQRYGLGRISPDGLVDRSFAPGSSNTIVFCLALQPDGKTLVGGAFTNLAGQARRYLGRLNVDGTLDNAFNPGVSNTVYALAVQPDGQILVGGDFLQVGGQARNHLARLAPDGRLDTSFNPSADATVYALALQPDGKILVGGSFWMLSNLSRSGLGRLNADGSVETSFNAQGSSPVYCLAVQPDGGILVGGSFSRLGSQNRLNLGRLGADGTLDSSFSPAVNGEVRSMLLQADGRILLAGNFTSLAGQTHYFLGRLNRDGSVDSTFTVGASDVVRSLALQDDGRVLLGGHFTSVGGANHTCVARLTNSFPVVQSLVAKGPNLVWLRDGNTPELTRVAFEVSVDGTNWNGLGSGTRVAGGWEGRGLSLPNSGTVRARGWLAGGLDAGSSFFTEFGSGPPAISRQPNSTCVRAGSTAEFSLAACGSLPLAYQWYKDGAAIPGATNAWLSLYSVVASQSGAAYQVLVTNSLGSITSSPAKLWVLGADSFNARLRGDREMVLAIALQGDGKVIIGGTFTNVAGFARTNLARLTPAGAVDETFDPRPDGVVHSLAIQEDGRILVGGDFYKLGGQIRWRLGRLNGDGSLDSTFAPDIGYRISANSSVQCLAIQPDHKILIGGEFDTINGERRCALGRLNADGSLDYSFYPPAYTNLPYAPNSSPVIYSIALEPEGDVVAFGVLPVMGGLYYLNWEWLTSGGSVRAKGPLTRFLSYVGNVYSAALQADGKILYGGGSYDGLTTTLTRLNRDTTSDTNFVRYFGGVIYSLGVQADGRILAGGSLSVPGGYATLARLMPDGNLDAPLDFTSLANDGTICAMAIQSDGKILVGGTFTNLAGLARVSLGRLNNSGPATQELSCDGTTISWRRADASPEFWYTSFDVSTNGTDWSSLGAGTRVDGGWELSGLSLSANATVRAHAFVANGSSGWFVESTAGVLPAVVDVPAPRILTRDSTFGLRANRFGFSVAGTSGQSIVIEVSTNLAAWVPVLTNTFGPSPFYFSEPSVLKASGRFYRARVQ